MANTPNQALAVLPARRRNKQEREHDLPLVARLYARGVPTGRIAEVLSEEHYPGERISIHSVSQDVGIIRKQWLESTLVEFGEAKARELAKLDELERAYWEAWQESIQESVTEEEITEDGDVPFINGSVGQSRKHRVHSTLKPGGGNVMYLQGIERCIQKRCQILGLFTPEKHQIDWRVEARDVWSDEDIDMVREKITNVFADALEKSKLSTNIDDDDIVDAEFSE